MVTDHSIRHRSADFLKLDGGELICTLLSLMRLVNSIGYGTSTSTSTATICSVTQGRKDEYDLMESGYGMYSYNEEEPECGYDYNGLEYDLNR